LGALCSAPAGLVRLGIVLRRVGRRLAAGEPIKIVAIGSSSTAGATASSPAATYPSRLAVDLKQRFPNVEITVLNRGVSGEEAADMLRRLDAQVIAEAPDLVLWQVGTNAVLRDHSLDVAARLIHEGAVRLKATGADIVLIDPQYSPRVIAKAEAEPMVDLIAAAAKRENFGLFRRFAVMRFWRVDEGMGFDRFISPDRLHLNDWSYACWAKLLGGAIAEAVSPIAAVAGTKLQTAH
jgi:lysophospholipase L1-like esterase